MLAICANHQFGACVVRLQCPEDANQFSSLNGVGYPCVVINQINAHFQDWPCRKSKSGDARATPVVVGVACVACVSGAAICVNDLISWP